MSYQFKIEMIKLKNGAEKPKGFRPTALNVIVGPNNSGKSHLLKEIRDAVYPRKDGAELIEKMLCQSIRFSEPGSYEELNDAYLIDKRMITTSQGYKNRDYCPPEISIDANGYITSRNYSSTLSTSIEWHPFACSQISEFGLSSLLPYIGASFVSYSGTTERPLLAYGEKRYGLKDPQTNLLSTVQYNYELQADLAEATKRLFGLDIALDIDSSEIAQFRTGSTFDNYRESKRNDGSKLDELFDGSPLKDAGDGLKGFVATYISLKIGNRPIVLIDEPETYLHPAQTYNLGKIIGESICPDTQLFVATHSSTLIEGLASCLSKSNQNDISLIKLNGKGASDEGDSARIITGESLYSFLHDPKLSHSRALDALFADRITLVESDADRIVYQQLIEKVGIDTKDALFIPTYSKDLMQHLAKFCNSIGTPCNAIVDLDLINNYEKLKAVVKVLEQKLLETKRTDFNRLHTPVTIINNVTDKCVDVTITDDEDKKRAKRTLYHNVLPCCKSCPEIFREAVRNFDRHREHLISNSGLLILSTGELETIFEDNTHQRTNKNSWLSTGVQRIDETSVDELNKLQITKDLRKLFSEIP